MLCGKSRAEKFRVGSNANLKKATNPKNHTTVQVRQRESGKPPTPGVTDLLLRGVLVLEEISVIVSIFLSNSL